MTLTESKKLANHMMRLLKVRYVSFPVAVTEKGPLAIKFTKDEEGYQMVLDAVPLTTKSIIDDENNIELKAMLEKYFMKDSLNELTTAVTFHADTLHAIDLEGIEPIDNGTNHITIETPEGWQCEREGCSMDYMHEHTTYDSLTQAQPKEEAIEPQAKVESEITPVDNEETEQPVDKMLN